MNLTWISPDVVPEVGEGTEKLFWLAVEIKQRDGTAKTSVFLAYYQNRPYREDEEEEEPDSGWLVSPDGEYVDSVRWVMARDHVEFADFYEPITFSDDYKMLGWAEYEEPEFTGISVLEPWQQRVVGEEHELKRRAGRLFAFLLSDDSAELDLDERGDLQLQHVFMLSLLEVLERRIARFK